MGLYKVILSIKRLTTKSCCGRSNSIFELEKPIRQSQIFKFRDAGYIIPDSMFKSGLFYVQLGNLIAICSFGATKVTVQCSGGTCEEFLNSFEALLEEAINS